MAWQPSNVVQRGIRDKHTLLGPFLDATSCTLIYLYMKLGTEDSDQPTGCCEMEGVMLWTLWKLLAERHGQDGWVNDLAFAL